MLQLVDNGTMRNILSMTNFRVYMKLRYYI